MKKILICAALACCLTAAAHSNDNDTVVVEKPRRVRIISSDSLQRVEVWGSSTNRAIIMKVIFKSLIAIM